MTETSVVSLDEVRERFLEAEGKLGDAAKAIQQIEAASTRMAAARDGLAAAGTEIRGLASQFAGVATSLSQNADELRRGVDAIRLGDPAAVRSQIEELDASLTVLQSVMAERFTGIETAQGSLKAEIERANARTDTSVKAMRTETRLIGIATVLMAVVIIVLLLVR